MNIRDEAVQTAAKATTEREELARVVWNVEIDDHGAFTVGCTSETAHLIADAVLDAGYRKPRVVTTEQEVDALPVGSIVLDMDGDDCVRRADGYWKVSDLAGGYASEEINIPATVLYEPEVTE